MMGGCLFLPSDVQVVRDGESGVDGSTLSYEDGERSMKRWDIGISSEWENQLFRQDRGCQRVK